MKKFKIKNIHAKVLIVIKNLKGEQKQILAGKSVILNELEYKDYSKSITVFKHLLEIKQETKGKKIEPAVVAPVVTEPIAVVPEPIVVETIGDSELDSPVILDEAPVALKKVAKKAAKKTVRKKRSKKKVTKII